jgi:hypothetical protein
VGLYGEDPKVVLDRRSHDKHELFETQIIYVYFCGWKYTGVFKDGNYYFGEQLREVETTPEPMATWRQKYWAKKPREREVHTEKGYLPLDGEIDKDEYNKKENCLIGMYTGFCKYPILQDIGINRILPAFSIYMKLTEWLSPKDDAPAPQSNENKIISAGFDTKTSFRNVK